MNTDLMPAEGPIYYQYKPEFPNYECFDFAFSAPWVCLDFQTVPCDRITVLPDGTKYECKKLVWYVWREYYEIERTVNQHIAALKARKDPPGFHVQCGFGDAAAPGDIEELGKLWCPMMADPEAKADFKRGIQEVAGLLSDIDCGPGNPHLYVDPSCTWTIYEFANYKWPKRRIPEDDEEPGESQGSGKPAKQKDHAMDALRYAAMHLNVLGARYHFSEYYQSPVKTGEPRYDHVPEPEALMRLPKRPIFSGGGRIF